VRPRDLRERLVAAEAGGFTSMSIAPVEIHRWSEAGTPPDEVRRIAADAGVRIAIVDPLARWNSAWELSADTPSELAAFCDFDPETVLEMASAIGADTVSMVDLLGKGSEPEEAAAAFHDLCRRAEPLGLRLALECVPFTGIRDLETAWSLVESAPVNGGLVVDAWHIFRGPDPGRNLDLLASIPAARIFAIQIDDAPAEPWDDLRAETMADRRLPGEGDQDLDRFLRSVHADGDGVIIGPEVLSSEIIGLPPATAGRLLGESMRGPLRQLASGAGN
jgi:sugar phosphate isomerase/epimerase